MKPAPIPPRTTPSARLILLCVVLHAAPCWSAPPENGRGETVSVRNSEFTDSQVTPVAAIADAVEYRSWKFLVIHHSATESGSVAKIDQEHRARVDTQGRPWRGIGYHFVIGNGAGMKDGEVQSTFRWKEQIEGAHAGQMDYNQYGIGICLIGNFEENAPTPAQLDSARKLVRTLQVKFQIADDQLLRHGDLKATACPGKLLEMKSMIADREQPVRHGMAAINNAGSPP